MDERQTAWGFPMRILVVEDERNVSAFIVQGLTEEGYVVDAVADGELALDFAQTYEYDLILLDVLLPKMDGREVARTLRRRGIHAPILMLTALDAVRRSRRRPGQRRRRLSGQALRLPGAARPHPCPHPQP